MIYTIIDTQEMDLVLQDKESILIDLEKDKTGTLTLNVTGEGSVALEINAGSNSNWKVLWLNNSDQRLNIIETINLDTNADLRLIYGELSQGNHVKNTSIHLKGQGSSVELLAAVLAVDSLEWSMQADHKARHTEANLSTNAIILDNGHLRLDVEGKIDKGFSGSKTHQMTRILNLGKETSGIVFPKLLIDENDVEASHAASVGQADPEHIFYLQSRGLSKLEAMRLMIKGYLAPLLNEINKEDLKERLSKEIDEKVNAYVQ